MVYGLTNNELAYRSITKSWFRHSMMAELMKLFSQSDYKVVLTTDHGSIRASGPIKIIGDRNTSTNLRYKSGKNSSYNAKEVSTTKDPRDAQLPSLSINTNHVFAAGDIFPAYFSNYDHCVPCCKDTLQHGGISMGEILIPLTTLTSRKR